jgi:hypothetical protein
MPGTFNIEVPRQGDWIKELQLTDIDGEPIDLTGHTFEWSARSTAGVGIVIASATVTIVEPLEGIIKGQWHGPDFDAVGIETEIVRVAHDLKDIYPDATIDVPFRGQIIVFPEVTA